jgi:DNA-binding GntR family transcriptional regulator
VTDAQWTGSSAPYLQSGQGDVWGKEAAAQGRNGTQRILRAEEVPASREVADYLDLAAGTPIVTRHRLIELDGRPIELAISHWPASLAAGSPLAQTGRIRGGAVSLLASMGYEPESTQEYVTTRPPTRGEAEALQLADNCEWILCLTRIIASGGRPYEMSVMVSPGRIGRLHYSMKVD